MVQVLLQGNPIYLALTFAVSLVPPDDQMLTIGMSPVHGAGVAGGQPVLPGSHLRSEPAAQRVRHAGLQERHRVLEGQEVRRGAVHQDHPHQLRLPGASPVDRV